MAEFKAFKGAAPVKSDITEAPNLLRGKPYFPTYTEWLLKNGVNVFNGVSVSASGQTLLYEVPAEKTLLITGFVVSTRPDVLGGGQADILINGKSAFLVLSTREAAGAATSAGIVISPPLQLPSFQKIMFENGANMSSTANIHGILVNTEILSVDF